jgi:L-threonylcarbamoyladenylate synthase
MMTEVWRLKESSDPASLIKKASEMIQSGRLVIFPTETVYGIGALPGDQKTLEKIYELKGRPKEKLFSWHLSSVSEIKKLSLEENPLFEKVSQKILPGPLTSIVRSNEGETVGVRIPDDPICVQLISKAGGALLATSANPSGKPSAITAEMAYEYFRDQADLILDTGRTKYAGDSTVVDFTSKPFKILRAGVYSNLQSELEELSCL